MSTIYPKDPLKKIVVCRREPECMHVLLRSVWWALLIVTPVCLALVSIFGWWCASVQTVGNELPASGAVDTKLHTDIKTVLSDMEERAQHYNKIHSESFKVMDPAPIKSSGASSGKTVPTSGMGEGLPAPVPKI